MSDVHTPPQQVHAPLQEILDLPLNSVIDVNILCAQARVDPGFPMGGECGPIFGGMDLRCEHFLVKMYVKTKELGRMGEGRAPENFVCRSANHKHEAWNFCHLDLFLIIKANMSPIFTWSFLVFWWERTGARIFPLHLSIVP